MTSFPDTPLAGKIAAQIAQSGQLGHYIVKRGDKLTVPSISFYSYMDACLYDEQFGYYASGAVKVGKEGDFYTSSAIGGIMAEALARYILEFSHSHERRDSWVTLAEWGAGTGKLSAGIAAAFRRQAATAGIKLRQLLIENHPAHAEAAAGSYKAAERKEIEAPAIVTSDQFLRARSEWTSGGSYLVLANELLDAFPVHRVRRRGDRLIEIGVSVVPIEGFVFTEMELSDPRLAEWLERDGIQLREGQVTEICPGARTWLMELGAAMTSGRVIIIDYGHDAEEYAAEHRMEGTLMTYRKHQASDSPLSGAGERDITAHVSYTFLKASAEEAGFAVVYYDTQKQFLVDNGVLGMLSNHDGTDPFGESARRNRAIRQLLLSDGMSESFKVMVLEKSK